MQVDCQDFLSTSLMQKISINIKSYLHKLDASKMKETGTGAWRGGQRKQFAPGP